MRINIIYDHNSVDVDIMEIIHYALVESHLISGVRHGGHSLIVIDFPNCSSCLSYLIADFLYFIYI